MKHYSCKADYLEDNGFTPDGYTYLVIGDNTYSIKDLLKSQGYVYSKLYGWHKSEPTQLPSAYKNIKVLYSDYQQWDPVFKVMNDLPDAYRDLKAFEESAYDPTPSNFLEAAPGDRIRDLPVTCRSISSFYGAYGYTRVISFLHGDDVLVWMTTSSCPIEENANYLLAGTVKKFESYKGEKQTHLSRVRLKRNENDQKRRPFTT